MLCVITHIGEDVFKDAQNHHHIQVNTVIKSLFDGSTEKQSHETINKFWSEYTGFNHRKVTFDIHEFICNNKDISYGKINIWNQKYSLPPTRVLGFVSCKVTSKIIGIGYAERSWGDVKIIKPGKISALGSDISENQIIVYKYGCIKEARIGRNLSHTDSKYGSQIHSWNDEDHAFDYQLDL